MTLIIPALDIMGGKCVRLVRGDPAATTVFGDDPVAIAAGFAAAGATRLHVVDLDAALGGAPLGLKILRQITEATGLDVQYGGGLRTLALLRQARQAGAKWVITGTAALADRAFLAAAAAEHQDALLLALDVRDGQLLVSGWREGAKVSLSDALAAAAECGVRRLMLTDAGADGTMAGVRPEYCASALGRGFELILAGGVASLADIGRLAVAAPVGLIGIVVGTALLRGTFTLAEAQAVIAQEVQQ